MSRLLAPACGLLALVASWEIGLRLDAGSLLPRPAEVAAAIGELAADGLLLRHVVASLFRVTWGFLAGVALALPVGLALGSARRAELAFGPLVELLRPISPLAWIPIAILWLGVGDLAAVAIITVASFLPFVLSVKNAVRAVPAVHLQAGRNFGLGGLELVRRVALPAALPRLVVGLRLTLGIAWLVVVAAEMIAVTSGLGYLIIDSRNAGNRYDLVVAGMVLIGVVGLLLDLAVRGLERMPAFAWALDAGEGRT